MSNSSLAQIRDIRIEKANKLRGLGIDPYPAKSQRTNKINEIVDNYEEFENKEVTLVGRLMSWREHGHLVFGNIQDQYGNIQLYIKDDVLKTTNAEEQIIGFSDLGLLDMGDIIQAKGNITKTQRGEISVMPIEIKILTKAIRPLPEKWTGLKDKETLFRQRYLDMIVNPEKRWRFEKTAQITFAIREFLTSKGFLEIKTPLIQPIYGGTNAKPFKTQVNALGVNYYLAVSHELYLKRLIAAGFENVFNINGYFRNEGIDRTHNPEFSMIETMSAYNNYEYNMELTEEMYRYIGNKVFNKTNFKVKGHEVDFAKPWRKLSMIDAVKQYTGHDFNVITKLEDAHKILKEIEYAQDMPASIGESLVKVFEEKVEKELIEPTFITGHPVEISPLAKQMASDPRYVERFEIYIGGIEGGDNWTELNDPVELYKRLKNQVDKGRGGDEEAHPMDIEFVEAMEHGIPPTTGLGPGIERLAMMLTETDYIDDVLFFPMMRPAQITEVQKEIYGEEYLIAANTKLHESLKSDESVTTKAPSNLPDKEKAFEMLTENIQNEYQVLHSRMVAKGLEYYASKLGADTHMWYLTGLFHDLDYDKYPEEHPHKVTSWLKEWGYPEIMSKAIISHDFINTKIMPKTLLDYYLIACDELSGLIYAYQKLTNKNYDELNVKSIIKKFNDPNFAAGVNRNDIKKGMEGLNIELEEHIQNLLNVFSTMKEFGGKEEENISANSSTLNTGNQAQDFGKKMVIVVNKELVPWQVGNTIGHVSAYLGNKINSFATGDNFVTKDAINHPRNSQYPIVILAAKPGQMANYMQKVRESGMLYHGFIKEMIDTTKDEEIVEILKNKPDAELEYLGIGVFGSNDEVDVLTKKFSLYK